MLFSTINTLGLTSAAFPVIYILGFYTFFAGLTQDGIVVKVLGRGVLREDILASSMYVNAAIEDLTKLLARREIANRLDLNSKYEETKNGIVFYPSEYSGWNTRIELRRGPELGWTTIVVSRWKEGRYDVRRDVDVEEYNRSGIAYLKAVLTEPRPEEQRKSYEIHEGNPEDSVTLIDSIVEESGGLIVHSERISTIGWLQIIGFVFMAAASFALIAIGGEQATLAGIGALVSMGVYLVFALPSRFGRRGSKHI